MTARCLHFGVCGGCSSQDVPYSAQLELKERRFREALNGVAEDVVEPVLPSPEVWHYRNKMEFAFGQEGDRLTLGLHPRRRLWNVVDVGRCEIFSEETAEVLEAVRGWAARWGLSAFYARKGTGQLRHLVIREGKNTGERMINLISSFGLERVNGLIETLKSTKARIDTVLWSRSGGVADVAQGEVASILMGGGFIRERVAGLELKVTPYGFMQTNTHAAEKMVEQMKNWLGRKEETGRRGSGRFGTLIDLYCGSGFLGLALADRFDSVVGVELKSQSLEAARANARANGITNADFVCGAVEEVLPKIVGALDPTGPLTLIADPPRVGLHKRTLASLLAVRPWALIYVSCNPESLARDLEALEGGYAIERILPMDFYPHTPHIESMTLLRPR